MFVLGLLVPADEARSTVSVKRCRGWFSLVRRSVVQLVLWPSKQVPACSQVSWLGRRSGPLSSTKNDMYSGYVAGVNTLLEQGNCSLRTCGGEVIRDLFSTLGVSFSKLHLQARGGNARVAKAVDAVRG